MDDPGGSILLQVLLILVLTLVNAFFAACEMAVITADDQNMRKLSEEGDARAVRLVKMLSRPSNFLAAIQVGITFATLLSGAASETFSTALSRLLAGTAIPASAAHALSLAIVTFLLSYVSLVIGELVPKRLAMHQADKVALHVTGVMHVISTVFGPFVWLLTASTNAIARLFGVSAEAEHHNVTEEQIRMMVDMGEETGTIAENEKEMINNVFEFDDINAGDIMTHRTDISAAEITDSVKDVLAVALQDGYSRIPIYEDDLDNIIGIVYVKDLLPYVGRALPPDLTLRDVMRKPLFVPETKHCRALFGVLTARKQHMAVVIDEYGGTSGIVTMEDLVESIVGDIQDEYDHEEQEFSVIDDSTYYIEGTADLEEVENLLGVELPKGEYDTIAGLIIDRLGHIPAPDEHPSIEVCGITFTVEEMDDRRIDKVRAYKRPPQPAAPGSDPAKEDRQRGNA